MVPTMLDRSDLSDRSLPLHCQRPCMQGVKSSVSYLVVTPRHCLHTPVHVGHQVDELAAQDKKPGRKYSSTSIGPQHFVEHDSTSPWT